LEGIATSSSRVGAGPHAGSIEVVDLVWKGLRQLRSAIAGAGFAVLKSLTWFGRDCDSATQPPLNLISMTIEVVDLVWKGLRQGPAFPRMPDRKKH